MTPVRPSDPSSTSASPARSLFAGGSVILTMIGDEGWACRRKATTPLALLIESLERQRGQCPHGDAARALRQVRARLVGPCRAGDVHVDPRHAGVDELL